MKRLMFMFLAVMLVVAGAALTPAQATVVSLNDGNSQVNIDTTTPGNPLNRRGVTSWITDGIDNLFTQQWFIGTNAAPGQKALDQLTFNAATGGAASTIMSYTGAGFTVDAGYTLFGGAAGSHTSDLSEQLRLTNTSTGPISFRLYLYADFDLNGQFSIPDTLKMDPDKHAALQTGKGWVSDSVVSPNAVGLEAGLYAATLAKLTGPGNAVLNGNLNAFGDATWCFEWDVTLAPNGTFLVSADKNIAPAPIPGSLLLLGSGLLGLVGLRRRS